MTAESLRPVGPRDRLLLLDVLRGVAVLGMLLANNNPGAYTQFLLPSALDRFIANLIEVLVRDKFWPLFALLFGIGCAIQIERADSRRISIVRPYLRRLWFLALIGGVLQCFIDVPQLLHLAIAGLPMLVIGHALWRRPRRALLVCVLALCGVCLGLSIRRDLAAYSPVVGQPELSAEEVSRRIEQFRGRAERSQARDATWSLDRFGPRALDVLRSYQALPMDVVRARGIHLYLLLYMLTGLLLWRTELLQEAGRRRRAFLCLLAVSLPIGIAAAIFTNAVQVAGTQAVRLGLGPYPSRFSVLLLSPTRLVASAGMALSYVAGLALLMSHAGWARALTLLAPVGRMALTNYAVQALWPALVFGFYTPALVPLRSLSGPERMAVLIGLFGVQIVFSRAWLRFCQFGPLEWLWRSLSYWELQPMRRARAA